MFLSREQKQRRAEEARKEHVLFRRAGFTWCGKCGSYSGGRHIRKLALPCEPPTAGGKRALRLLWAGKRPKGEGKLNGLVEQLGAAEAAAFLGEVAPG